MALGLWLARQVAGWLQGRAEDRVSEQWRGEDGSPTTGCPVLQNAGESWSDRQVLVQRHFLISGLTVLCLGRPGLPVRISAMQIDREGSSHMHL